MSLEPQSPLSLVASNESARGALRPLEFFVIRYMPHVGRGEFINIGIVVREVEKRVPEGGREARVRITRDWRRVEGVFPFADLYDVKGMEVSFEKSLMEGMGQGERTAAFDRMLNQLSLSIHITDAQGCLAADLDTQLEFLMRLLVDSPEDEGDITSETVRITTEAAMEEVQAKSNLPRCFVYRYVGHSDDLIIDYSYASTTSFNLIHSIGVDSGLNEVLALASRMDELREGVLRVEGLPLKLTVVVEDEPEKVYGGSEAEERYTYALTKLHEKGVKTVPVSDLPALVKAVKDDLIDLNRSRSE